MGFSAAQAFDPSIGHSESALTRMFRHLALLVALIAGMHRVMLEALLSTTSGRLLIAEHGLDGLNFLAFGPGVLSFLKPSTWTKYIEEAGLVVKHHEHWHGLVHLWVAERKQR